MANELAHMIDDDIEGSREERAFRQWINSLGIEDVFINNLYEDLRDGLVLLKVIHKINPTLVSWDKVAKKPRNIFEKGHNCELALSACQKMKEVRLIGIGNSDIRDGNKKLILAVAVKVCCSFTFYMRRVEGSRSRLVKGLWVALKTQTGKLL